LNNKFTALGISSRFTETLQEAGYQTPTKIQSSAIPDLLEGRDVLGVAQTGTGKTAAFGLPLLQRLASANRTAKPRCPRALVLAPTRELAIQIFEELSFFAKGTSLRLTSIFGGVGQNPQVKKLAKGVDIVIATPGRLLDLTSQNHLDLGSIEILVLDEADRLMDMGFIRDVQKIIRQTPRSRQSLLFSATMPKEVDKLANEILNKPKRIEVAPKQVTVEKITQQAVMVDSLDKRPVLISLLFKDEVTKAIVFTRTKHGANKLAKQLNNEGISAEAIHGNKSQNARNRALQNFSNGNAWVLVATDVAARGIDIEKVSHVFNFELPHEPESYVHRIGRTARAGASGAAVSLVDPSEIKRLKAVERLIGFAIPRENVDVSSLPARSHVAVVQPATVNANQSNAHQSNSGKRSRRRHNTRRKVA